MTAVRTAISREEGILAVNKKATDRIIDEYLVLQVQGGDREALDLLIQRWQPSFMRFAQVVTRNPDMAADAVQDSWIRILRHIHKLRDPVAWESWSYRVVSRICLDRVQKAQRFSTLEEESTFDPRGDWENQEAVLAVLGQMSEDHRMVLALHYLQGFEVVEMAKILGIPEGTVKSRLHHARQKFKQVTESTGATDNGRTRPEEPGHAKACGLKRHGLAAPG